MKLKQFFCKHNPTTICKVTERTNIIKNKSVKRKALLISECSKCGKIFVKKEDN